MNVLAFTCERICPIYMISFQPPAKQKKKTIEQRLGVNWWVSPSNQDVFSEKEAQNKTFPGLLGCLF